MWARDGTQSSSTIAKPIVGLTNDSTLWRLWWRKAERQSSWPAGRWGGRRGWRTSILASVCPWRAEPSLSTQYAQKHEAFFFSFYTIETFIYYIDQKNACITSAKFLDTNWLLRNMVMTLAPSFGILCHYRMSMNIIIAAGFKSSPHNSATGSECLVAVSARTPPSSCLPPRDLKAPDHNKAAGNPREVLHEKTLGWILNHENVECENGGRHRTSDWTSPGQFPVHETQRVDIGPLERLKVAHVDGLVQDFRGHVPAEGNRTIDVLGVKHEAKVHPCTFHPG